MTEFPSNSIQGAFNFNEWWVNSSVVKKGSLIRIICPFFDKEAWRVLPIGRTDPTDHQGAKMRLERYGVDAPSREVDLPVAALAVRKGESLGIWRTKVRPAIVLSVNDSKRTEDSLKSKTILVAPYYGIKPGPRIGFPPEFIRAVKIGNFKQFMWDILPIGKGPEGSLLRLDRMITIPMKAQMSYSSTGYCLSDDAVEYLDEWTTWFFNGCLPKESGLFEMLELINPRISENQN